MQVLKTTTLEGKISAFVVKEDQSRITIITYKSSRNEVSIATVQTEQDVALTVSGALIESSVQELVSVVYKDWNLSAIFGIETLPYEAPMEASEDSAAQVDAGNETEADSVGGSAQADDAEFETHEATS